MNSINIAVANKIATNLTPDFHVVCGNSDYVITFDFDDEWFNEANKVARFVYFKGHQSFYKEQAFTGNTVNVPVLSDIDYVLVGVYAGDLSTTTPARVRCKRSILCGAAEEQITDEEKESIQSQITDLLNQMNALAEDLDGQVADSVEKYLEDFELTSVVNAALEQAKESGEFDGKDGYTPVKGVDYFDGQDGKNGIDGKDGKDGYTPVKGVDYFDGQPGKNGADGKDGADGYSPVRGKDYWTDADKLEIKSYVDEAILGGEW